MRTSIILLVLNAIVALLLVLTRDPGQVETRRTLVPADRDVRTATRIEFSASREKPAFVLVRDQKKKWRLDSADGPLANQGAVRQIVATLRRAPILPFETGDGDDVGLTPPQRTVTVHLAEGDPVVVAIGRVIGLGAFARYGEETAAYLSHASFASLLGHQAAALRELRPFACSPLDVKGLRLLRRTLQGVQIYDAERRWLTWFFSKPQPLRGDARALDGIVASMISVERSRAVVAPQAMPKMAPSVEVTLRTAEEAVTLDLWARSQTESRWIARVRGEDAGFTLIDPRLRQLLLPFEQLWDPRLLHDSSRQIRWVEWAYSGSPAVRVARRMTDQALVVAKPRPAPGQQATMERFLQDLVRVRAVGVDPAGTDPAAVGLSAPIARFTVRAELGDGEQTFEVGKPKSGVCRVRIKERPDIFFLVPEAVIRERLPVSALALIDRSIFAGDWKVLDRIDVRRTDGSVAQLTNAGIREQAHWQRTVFTDRKRGKPEPIASNPMRNLLVKLAALEGERVIAWSKGDAAKAWGCDRPVYRVEFADRSRAGQPQIKIGIGPVQPDPQGLGDDWCAVWIDDERLSERPFVYRISADLIKLIKRVVP